MIKKLLFTFIIFFNLLSVNAYSFENKIILKVDNEIVTSIDILNESNYIKAMLICFILLQLKLQRQRPINVRERTKKE